VGLSWLQDGQGPASSDATAPQCRQAASANRIASCIQRPMSLQSLIARSTIPRGQFFRYHRRLALSVCDEQLWGVVVVTA
jgi:hypothetical protein